MTKIEKNLDSILHKELSKTIIPVKTSDGILVGDILIVSDGHIKHLKKDQDYIYKNISLNAVAILLANLLAKRQKPIKMDKIWQADQVYGRWFTESQMLRSQYHKALSNKNFDRADMLWARYQESRDRTFTAKKHVESLISF